MRAKLFFMITTTASNHFTLPALYSLFSTSSVTPSDSVVLVDNDASFTESIPTGVSLVKNNIPLGFAENVNQAIALALKEEKDLYLLNNDIILSKGWLEQLATPVVPSITSPLSNREVSYVSTIVNVATKLELATQVYTNPCQLEDYQEKEEIFEAIASQHYKKYKNNFTQQMVTPFFCTKISLEILQKVGMLDTSFGKAGAEDYDYCLRAWLAGFPILTAAGAYVLHFGGKSSWNGGETKEERNAREEKMFAAFREKWGEGLFKLLFHEDTSHIPEGLQDPVSIITHLKKQH